MSNSHKTISRRKILTIIGGGTILAATASVGGFLTTRTPNKALAPWSEAGTYTEPRRRFLSYAILAPNPHNRQPWLVDLSEENKIILYVDTKKMLTHTDPFNRQITIGLGCFIEILRMAAAENGYMASVESFPNGFDNKKLDKRPVAIISLKPDATVSKDPLFAHIFQRRSNKQPYDLDRPLSKTVLTNFKTSHPEVTLGTTKKPNDITQLRALTHQAMQIEIQTPRTYKESVDLYRLGKSEINKNPDGIDLGGPLLDSMSALGLFSREAALDVNSSAYSQGIDIVMASIDSAMGYVWLITNGNSRQDQLTTGREWVRTNLTATANGLAMQPLSQALQEYPEMAETYKQMHKYLNAEGKVVQMLARLGYATPVAPSPRWPIEAKILT